MENISYISFLGFVAIFLNILQRSKQLRNTVLKIFDKDLVLSILHIENTSFVLYIAYGFFSTDLLYLISNVINFCFNLIILSILFFYSEHLNISKPPTPIEHEDRTASLV